MRWVVVVIGDSPSAELITYLEKTHAPFILSEDMSPFDAHKKYKGYDYIICMNCNCVPTKDCIPLDELFKFDKINVAWDSYGRNYPHKTSVRYSTDLIGIPASAAHITAIPDKDLYILPKTVNVSEGFLETHAAHILNIKKRTAFVKFYNCLTGAYT